MSAGNGVRVPNGEGARGDSLTPHSRSKETAAGVDDFGLPKRPLSRQRPASPHESDDGSDTFHDATDNAEDTEVDIKTTEAVKSSQIQSKNTAVSQALPSEQEDKSRNPVIESTEANVANSSHTTATVADHDRPRSKPAAEPSSDPVDVSLTNNDSGSRGMDDRSVATTAEPPKAEHDRSDSPIKRRDKRSSAPAVSEWSHQALAPRDEESDEEEEVVDWQAMPALGEFDIYDDNGRIVAKAQKEVEADNGYAGIGGQSKGYTRVQLDEDAQSATSLDDDTNYLFKRNKAQVIEKDEFADEDEEQRDALTQLETTKDLLTEGQRIAYVGVVRLTIYKMHTALEDMERTRTTKKELNKAQENMELWGQKMMVRLYSHMEIDSAEQLMIEQLAEHGVQPSDLAPPLMENARIKNPMAEEEASEDRPTLVRNQDSATSQSSSNAESEFPKATLESEEVPEVHSAADMPRTDKIDLDLRWTVLCDLFLVLISDGSYDSRSRRLLERVASTMQITWIQICRFEKRVMDALEMQEAEFKENHDEGENMEKRRKLALNRKYMVMGLATVGGGIVIGLSAGLLAPMIGAGLAAGFTTIGVTGTAGFLGGVGGAALVTSIGVTTGGTIAVRAAHRRTGHVRTFEYRPLHNNKRLNLILTVSGWMNGKVDDVRLPYSTVDPIMGDIYALLWEPEMLQSMGDTINILATEALTQTVQQVLGSTILVALMASIQLPVVLTKLAYLIDNPWSVSLDRANAAGLILADSLTQKHLGGRPITLIGFSLGARLIFSCLRELSNRGAYGIIQNVYLFGSPIVAKKDEYLRARSVISGRFVNGYASNDWILGYLFRATSGGIMRIAGLAPVEDVPGLENLDVSALVNGHMAYRTAMPRLLREVGWEVESDEFTEIEDPDPENHQNRQRELILEINDARRKAEEKPEKKRFGFFKRGMLAEKRGWETYEVGKAGQKQNPGGKDDPNASPGLESSVLFDIDAIRKELESEMIEVRELDSTLPPMQITSIKDGEKHTEYLRLPPEVNLSKHEVARMKLPPRPEDIDVGVGVGVAPAPPALPPKRFSWKRSPKMSPQSPKRSPSLKQEDEYVFEGPKELTSTLPPLTLTPALSHTSFETTAPSRPTLKTHATAPAPSSWEKTTASPLSTLTSPVDGLNIEHNAWADDSNFGKEQEVKMTFE